VVQFWFDTRRPIAVSQSFVFYFSSLSYQTDSAKATAINPGSLARYLNRIVRNMVFFGNNNANNSARHKNFCYLKHSAFCILSSGNFDQQSCLAALV
jgi:hypothetical protein